MVCGRSIPASSCCTKSPRIGTFRRYTSMYSNNRRYRDHLHLIVCETVPVVKREHTWQASIHPPLQHRSQSRELISLDSLVLPAHTLEPGHFLDV
jgi:hypothetical protein